MFLLLKVNLETLAFSTFVSPFSVIFVLMCIKCKNVKASLQENVSLNVIDWTLNWLELRMWADQQTLHFHCWWQSVTVSVLNRLTDVDWKRLVWIITVSTRRERRPVEHYNQWRRLHWMWCDDKSQTVNERLALRMTHWHKGQMIFNGRLVASCVNTL